MKCDSCKFIIDAFGADDMHLLYRTPYAPPPDRHDCAVDVVKMHRSRCVCTIIARIEIGQPRSFKHVLTMLQYSANVVCKPELCCNSVTLPCTPACSPTMRTCPAGMFPKTISLTVAITLTAQ